MRFGHLLSVILLSLPLHAQAAQHEHPRDVVAGSPCTGQMLPSLRCARATSVAFDDKGWLWAAWVMGGHVYVNHSEDGGNNFSPPAAVNRIAESIADDGENRPKIVVRQGGLVYVSWTQRLPAKYSGHVRFSRSEDGGRTFSEPLIINSDRALTSHRFDALAATDDGRVYLFWLDKRDRLAHEKAGTDYIGAAIYYDISHDYGRTFAGNRKLADHSCECCRIALDLDGRGIPVVVWRHVFGDHVRDHALVSFDATERPGAVHRATFSQWRVESCPHHGPSLAVTDDAAYHLVWYSGAPEQQGLFYARSKDGGHSFSTPQAFGDNAHGASHPYILAQGRRLHVVWKEFDGQQTVIRAMHSQDGGEHWSAPVAICDTKGKSDHPLLIADKDRIVLSWQTEDEGLRLVALGDSP